MEDKTIQEEMEDKKESQGLIKVTDIFSLPEIYEGGF